MLLVGSFAAASNELTRRVYIFQPEIPSAETYHSRLQACCMKLVHHKGVETLHKKILCHCIAQLQILVLHQKGVEKNTK